VTSDYRWISQHQPGIGKTPAFDSMALKRPVQAHAIVCSSWDEYLRKIRRIWLGGKWQLILLFWQASQTRRWQDQRWNTNNTATNPTPLTK
jgi:hypothetical protein